MAIEQRPFIDLYACLINPDQSERWVRMSFDGDDHEAAARQAAEYLSHLQVRELNTYNGLERRRWQAGTAVEEIGG